MTARAQRAAARLLWLALAAALAHGAASASPHCSAWALHHTAYAEAATHNLTRFKAELLGKAVDLKFNTTFDLPGNASWRHYDLANPFLQCPPRHPAGLARYGSGGDGGKLLCDLSVLPDRCMVYSLGSNGDYSFEQDILAKTSCEVHTFDCTYEGRSVSPGRHFYHRTCIGKPPSAGEEVGGAINFVDAATGEHKSLSVPGAGKARESGQLDFRTLSDVMASLGHSARRVDVMKMDIEGHEMQALSSLKPEDQLPEQLVVELHFFRGNPVPGVSTLSPNAPRDTAQLSLLLAHMASLGYGIAARDDNTVTADVACCSEITFLRVEGRGGPVPRGRHRAGAARGGAAGGGVGGGAAAAAAAAAAARGDEIDAFVDEVDGAAGTRPSEAHHRRAGGPR